jgi:hypothetical protein
MKTTAWNMPSKPAFSKTWPGAMHPKRENLNNDVPLTRWLFRLGNQTPRESDEK